MKRSGVYLVNVRDNIYIRNNKGCIFKMARVAREMVEKSGVNIDKLLDLLVKNAAAELTTYYYYTINHQEVKMFIGLCLEKEIPLAGIKSEHLPSVTGRFYVMQ